MIFFTSPNSSPKFIDYHTRIGKNSTVRKELQETIKWLGAFSPESKAHLQDLLRKDKLLMIRPDVEIEVMVWEEAIVPYALSMGKNVLY